MHVKQNRRNILDKIGLTIESEEQLVNSFVRTAQASENNIGDGTYRFERSSDLGSEYDYSTEQCTDDQSESSIIGDNENKNVQEKKIILTLSAEEWDSIKPSNISYKSFHPPPYQKYFCLTPHIWTSIVSEHFWDVCSMPCCLVFKRAQLTTASEPFVVIKATCKGCRSLFYGVMKNEPPDGKKAIFKCSYRGKFDGCFAAGKRRLTGIHKNMAVSANVLYRHLQAGKSMNVGDAEPAYLPTGKAL